MVEEPGDVIPIERTNEWNGRYHVLGGALSPIDGIDPEDLKLAQLADRVDGTVVSPELDDLGAAVVGSYLGGRGGSSGPSGSDWYGGRGAWFGG